MEGYLRLLVLEFLINIIFVLQIEVATNVFNYKYKVAKNLFIKICTIETTIFIENNINYHCGQNQKFWEITVYSRLIMSKIIVLFVL